VGEIHPCPKCASMVCIVAPASPTDAAAPTGAAPAIAGAGLAARLAGLVGQHALAWSVCGAALVIGGSLAVSLMGGGDEQVAARADQAAIDVPNSIDKTKVANDELVENKPTASATSAAVDERRSDSATVTRPAGEKTDLPAALPPLPTPPADDATSAGTDEVAAVDDRSPASTTPATAPASDSPDDAKPESTRTLRLDPLGFDPTRTSLGNVTERMSTGAARDYPPELDEGAPVVSAKPQAAEKVDVATQLAVQLKSIDVPSTSLADFIRMVSEMAAVPIKLDPSAGVSPQTKVTARGQDVTLGELLDDVLATHGLAHIERDGQIVVVKRSGP